MEKRVVIFCASSGTIDPKYNQAARQLVEALHARGYTVVSGGGARGTMGAVTAESVRTGGRHVSVVPEFMRGRENPDVTEIIWTETMSQRKECMRAGTCAAIALPGGIGTLDELMETHTLRKLHRYDGDIFALNLDGFYDPLKRLLSHFADTEMTARKDIALIRFPETVTALLEYLK